MSVGLLLMAAGRSRRFKVESQGMHKLLYKEHSADICILEATYQKVCKVFDPQKICIIVNEAEPEVKQFATQLGSPLQEVCSDGIGSSIAQAVKVHQNWSALLILHADLPLVQSATIYSVLDALKDKPAVRPMYKKRAGHPVGFQAYIYPELIALEGDQGGNKIFAQHAVTFIPVQDQGSVQDIDTLEDFKKYLKSL